MVVLCDGAAELGAGVLHTMSFVDNHVKPLDFAKDRPIFDNEFVSGEQDLEVAVSDLLLMILTLRWRAFVDNSLNAWRPLLEFVVPVGECAEGHNDQERP